MRNLVLFGPPGIGKSTVIRAMRQMGFPTLDLERVFDRRCRYACARYSSGMVLGAADIDPKDNLSNCLKILLVLPEDEYRIRRADRDKIHPSKANQRQHTVGEWKKLVDYDYVLVNRSLQQTCDNLSMIYNKEAGNIYQKGGMYGSKC